VTDITTYSDDQAAQIVQLQQQQALFTQALAAAVSGKWVGAGSVEAFLYALDPGLQGTIDTDPPITESEYGGDEPPKA
jgi:hypothetical protein